MKQRRIGTERSANRAVLIEAAAAVIRDQGYAAVSAREVALKAGLKPQLVHYYFRTMDDLLLAVLQYGAEERLRDLAEAVFSDQPLRALWKLNRNPRSTALELEIAALANHHPKIRDEVKRLAERYRTIQIEALAHHLQQRSAPVEVPPAVMAMLITGVSHILVREEALGMTVGHADTEAFVAEWLNRLSDQTKPRPKKSGKRKRQPRG